MLCVRLINKMSQIVSSLEMAKKQYQAPKNIELVIELCNKMLELADFGDNCREDKENGVFYGALRDSAYKIRRLAKNELIRHESKNTTSSLS